MMLKAIIEGDDDIIYEENIVHAVSIRREIAGKWLLCWIMRIFHQQ